MCVKYAQAFVMLAGESARWTSCSRALTLVQIRKVTRFQVVLIGTAYWSGLVDWLRGTLLPSGKIKSTDLRLFTVTRLRRGGRRRHLRRPLATRRTQSTDNRVVLAAAATAPMFVADRSAWLYMDRQVLAVACSAVSAAIAESRTWAAPVSGIRRP